MEKPKGRRRFSSKKGIEEVKSERGVLERVELGCLIGIHVIKFIEPMHSDWSSIVLMWVPAAVKRAIPMGSGICHAFPVTKPTIQPRRGGLWMMMYG